MEYVIHCFDPVTAPDSRILMLGTMPSPASRENGFYYSHPRNRFWSVMGRVLERPVPQSADEKKALLLSEHIALWDVLKACEIDGASDGSIRRAEPNDLRSLIKQHDLRAVFCTGTAAYKEYMRFFGDIALPAYKLPSTSPANARMTLDALEAEYRVILQYLDK